MRISDWSSDVGSSDLHAGLRRQISGAAQCAELADHQGRARDAFSQGALGRFPADEPVVLEAQTLYRQPDEDIPRPRPARSCDLRVQAGQPDAEYFRPEEEALGAHQRLAMVDAPCPTTNEE